MDLTNRIAKCSCGKEMPSSPALAFFVYCGEGSSRAESTCKVCAYHAVAHERAQDAEARHLRHIADHAFAPRGAFEFDDFYCGCRGWD